MGMNKCSKYKKLLKTQQLPKTIEHFSRESRTFLPKNLPYYLSYHVKPENEYDLLQRKKPFSMKRSRLFWEFHLIIRGFN